MKINRSYFAPLVLLSLLSFFIGEVLIGSTLISHFDEIIRIVPTLLFYGTGVLLVRETKQRFNLPWSGVLGLGLSYGLFEEGIILNTIFNPNALGFDFSYGRMVGVNWIWAVTIVVYHAIWSITIPVIVIELFFPQQGQEKWLGGFGYGILIGLFSVSAIILYVVFHQFYTYTPTLNQFVFVSILLTIFIIALLKRSYHTSQQRKAFHPVLVGIIAFISALLLFIFQIVVFEKSALDPWIILMTVLILLVSVMIIFSRWHLYFTHQLALVGALLLASALYGLLIVQATGTPVDVAAQIVFIIVIPVSGWWLKRRYRLRGK